MTEVYFDNKDESVTLDASAQKTTQGIYNMQEFIEEVAKANGVSTQEAAAALEENGWDVSIIEQLHD